MDGMEWYFFLFFHLFSFLAGPCACRDLTRGSGRRQPSLAFLQTTEQKLSCLLVCSSAVLHTSGSGLGMATWLAGWLLPLLLSGWQDRMAGWSRRDVAARYGGEFAWRCAAMDGWIGGDGGGSIISTGCA